MTHQLQIPISEELNKQLQEKVQELGFSSIGEAAHFLLTNLANGNLSIGFIEKNMENWENIEETLREALEEQKEGKTKSLDFSRLIHEQIIEGL